MSEILLLTHTHTHTWVMGRRWQPRSTTAWKKDSFLFLGTTNQRKRLPSVFRSPHHVADASGRCWCFYLQYAPPPDHHLSHNKKQFEFPRLRVNGCQGHSWKATVVWIVSRRRSGLIIVPLAHSQIMIPIDKESRLLIAPHFINFAPRGPVGCHGGGSNTLCHLAVIRIQKSSLIPDRVLSFTTWCSEENLTWLHQEFPVQADRTFLLPDDQAGVDYWM